MRVREKMVCFWTTYDEYYELKNLAEKTGLSISEFIRQMVKGYQPNEKPDKEFYDSVKLLRSVSNSLNQLARRANALNFIDELEYKKNVDFVNSTLLDIKRKFLLPKKIENKKTDD